MKKRKKALVLFSLILLPLLLYAGGGKETTSQPQEELKEPSLTPYSGGERITAYEIMEKTNDSLIAGDIIADITMTLENAKGNTRVRELSIISKEKEGLNRSVLHFTSPADIEGTGFLMIETDDGSSDMWLYLPELGKSRKIVSSGKNDSFMGSDISYSDMEGRPLEKYTFFRFADETVGGESCYVIEARAVDSSVIEDTGYSRTLYFISKEKLIPLKGWMFAPDGTLLKQMVIGEVKLIDLSWIPSSIEVKHVVEDHTTRMELKNIELNSDPDEAYFTQQYLKRGH